MEFSSLKDLKPALIKISVLYSRPRFMTETTKSLTGQGQELLPGSILPPIKDYSQTADEGDSRVRTVLKPLIWEVCGRTFYAIEDVLAIVTTDVELQIDQLSIRPTKRKPATPAKYPVQLSTKMLKQAVLNLLSADVESSDGDNWRTFNRVTGKSHTKSGPVQQVLGA